MQMTSLVRANFLILNSRSGTNLVSDRYYRLEIVTLAFLLIYIALQVATYPLFVSSSWCYLTIKLQLRQKSDCKCIYVDYRNGFRKVVNLGELQQLDYGLLCFHEMFKDAKICKMHTIIVLTKKVKYIYPTSILRSIGIFGICILYEYLSVVIYSFIVNNVAELQ